MPSKLKLYNTYNAELEEFEPLQAPFVGMYLCGPTVYGDPHLGHSRGPILMDILYRYLMHLGYKVRYVRNITDVGHLQNDSDDGDDKIAKKARLDQVEPMEIVQKYTIAYHKAIDKLNVLPPSIEPRATAHIQEQINMVKGIIENGYAYEVNGSVYFDVLKYAEDEDYGKLSGRKIEDLIAGAGEERRALEGQDEKRNPNDFALWKKASEEHIMKWESPWGIGFPGWHIECSAMSSKYLGEYFDIHAGGMDLLFPHHESEIAQSTACFKHTPCKYWLHNNMITINGQKMAKSLNNGILLEEMFSGDHHLLDKAYSPLTMKFFLLMAHYRSTVDFSNEALSAAEKGLKRLSNAIEKLDELKSSDQSEVAVEAWKENLYEAMNNDLNTPKAIAFLFEAVKWINEISSSKLKINEDDLKLLSETFKTFFFDILGLKLEDEGSDKERIEGLVNLLMELRQDAKTEKNWAMADKIRDDLKNLGVDLMDGKEGSSFKLN
ncbi:cysteine--tRNA ligase [bacterium]|nr:cysteine--tRNA ligase [bacterium]